MINLSTMTTGRNNLVVGWREVDETQFWQHIYRASPSHSLSAHDGGLLYRDEAGRAVGWSTTTPERAFYILTETHSE